MESGAGCPTYHIQHVFVHVYTHICCPCLLLDTGFVRLEFDCVPSEKSAGHESNLSLSTSSYRRKSMTMPGDAMLLSSWQSNYCEFDVEFCSESEHDDPVHERGEAPVPDLEIE